MNCAEDAIHLVPTTGMLFRETGLSRSSDIHENKLGKRSLLGNRLSL